jgi:hypothetical protein
MKPKQILRKHHLIKHPQKNTCWCIMGITPHEVYKAQKYLFNLGFSYHDKDNNAYVKDTRICTLGSVFNDNIFNGTLTYSTDRDYMSTVNTAKKHSGKDHITVFEWVNGYCVFKEIIHF